MPKTEAAGKRVCDKTKESSALLQITISF